MSTAIRPGPVRPARVHRPWRWLGLAIALSSGCGMALGQAIALGQGTVTQPPAAASTDSTRGFELDYRREIAEQLRRGEFDRLEERAALLRREHPRLPSGLSELRAFYRGLSETLPGEPVTAGDELMRRLEE